MWLEIGIERFDFTPLNCDKGVPPIAILSFFPPHRVRS